MRAIAILIPSLRPQLWDRIRAQVEATTPNGTVYFLGAEHTSYAKAVNAGWTLTDEPLVFTGADDIEFAKGWARAAVARMKGPIRVVGSNDLHNPHVLQGVHSTHSLVDRRYLEQVGGVIDEGPGSFLFEYDHNYPDVELVETARHRGVFAPCLEAVVEHRHPDFSGRKPDAVHKKTRRNLSGDYATFMARRGLWTEGDTVPDYVQPDG